MEHVDPLVLELIESWPTIPAFVMGPTLDVLAANRLAVALSPRFAVGTNLARITFFDEVAADGSPRAARISELVVELLRDAATQDADTRDLRALVGELASQSDEFAKVWSSAEPAAETMQFPMSHPVVGDLALAFHHLALPGAAKQTMVVVRVEPGSTSEQGLFRLAAMLADEDSSHRG